MPHPCQTYSLPEGVELSFTDSGPPLYSNDYTTVVVIHGSVFNANQFQILHQYAHAHNLRTVLLHRRGYIGSTPYTSEELREINHGSKEFWERLSAQLVQFLEMLVEKEHIPKLQNMSSHMSGGLAIMGWSAGCQMILALLGVAHSPMISNKGYVLLQNYIGKFLLYDPPYVAFRYPDPLEDIKYYVPWKDTSLPPEALPVAFSEWVGSYYDHPYYEHEPRKSPSLTTIHDLDGLPKRKAENSLASWSDEEKAMGIEPQAGEAEVLTCVLR
ncbi:hypothetical protein C8R42DRAFT_594451 [Lentinula raphanica]|nr:hypothetical protein C8R42DRAFT_594451 [Lentinula raphanica]